jgi:hypothetical protein
MPNSFYDMMYFLIIIERNLVFTPSKDEDNYINFAACPHPTEF